jgi:hypothetical protein
LETTEALPGEILATGEILPGSFEIFGALLEDHPDVRGWSHPLSFFLCEEGIAARAARTATIRSNSYPAGPSLEYLAPRAPRNVQDNNDPNREAGLPVGLPGSSLYLE